MPATPNTWDSPPAVLSWDAPAANATWDSTTPAPPPPKPKKKPFRRKAKPQPPNPQPSAPFTLMPNFQYHIAPLASGGFTTRAVRTAPAPQSVFTDHIAAAAGITPAQVELAIPAFFAKLAECASGCAWSPELYGCVGFTPTSGGNEPSPADFHTPDDLNADIAISLSAGKIRDWRAGLTLESLGEVGLLTPIIDSIIDITTGLPDVYTLANMIQLRGNYLRFKLSDLNQGVFLRSGNNPEVRATLYGQNEPGIVSLAIPAALTGPLAVRIAAFINGSIRSYTYTQLISPA